jgi:thiol-disulfide isomerase/thioredoxin
VFRPLLFIVLIAIGGLRCAASETSPATAPAVLRITGIDGQSYQPLAVEPHKAAVLVFVLQDCPICNGYAPLIQRLAAQFSPQGASFYLIHVDPTLSTADAVKHAKEFGYQLPVLIDRKHDLVGRVGIQIAPTAVVVGSDGAPRYKGRIDDQYAGLGKPRTVATTHELRDAIAAVLEDKPVPVSQTRAIGCAVPDLPAHGNK